MSKSSEIQELVTNAVLHQLENGRVPWHKSFKGLLPSSGTTGKPYRGINPLLLGIFGAEFNSHLWVTFKGAQSLGGSVLKGSKSVQLVKYGTYVKGQTDAGKDITGAYLTTFNVFNLDQTTGCEVNPAFMVAKHEHTVPSAVESMLNTYTTHPAITHSTEGRAYYTPTLDTLTMPEVGLFDSGTEYALTLAHELGHSTGHSSRLDRWDGSAMTFGCATYAREELVAEMTSVMVCNELGLEVDIQNSASYLAGWLGALKNDPAMLIKASGQAVKSMNLILGLGD